MNAIGGAFLALSLYPLSQSYFPPKATTATVVRIRLGLANHKDSGANIGGDIPEVSLFNANGERIGFTMEGGHIQEDSSTLASGGDIRVEHINQKKDAAA